MKTVTITHHKNGARRHTKVSYPIRYGRYGEIRTPKYTYQFNLNGEIKYIQGRGGRWPSPSEWLKRTQANDWVYYLAGDYSGVQDAFGEYYLPCPNYPTNTIITRNLFEVDAVGAAITAWHQDQQELHHHSSSKWDDATRRFIQRICRQTPAILKKRACLLHEIIGGPVTVLPPDTRHVDYEVIPVTIADGCLYQCDFCCVKSNRRFRPRTKTNIADQIQALKRLFRYDLRNYNAVFLGTHDALAADPELILFAAENAYDILELEATFLVGARLFLFGSVDSFMGKKTAFFDTLQALPYTTSINIGFESADAVTLRLLQKPVSAKMVENALVKMQAINRQYPNIEITANFVYGDHLPKDHLPTLYDLVNQFVPRPYPKGTIYFSPLVNHSIDNQGKNAAISQSSNIIRNFYKIKSRIPLPSYLYLIQRL